MLYPAYATVYFFVHDLCTNNQHFPFQRKFLDKSFVQLGKSLLKRCNDSKPVILLMDNINMYRRRKRQDRLFTEVGPKKRNFTGRAAIILDLTDVEDLLA